MSSGTGAARTWPDGAPPADELAEFLGSQRWFSRRGGDVEVLAVRPMAHLVDDPSVDVVLVDTRTDGHPATYQLALERPGYEVERLAHARVGSGPVYDALHDREVTEVWPRLIAAEATVDQLRFHRAVHGPRRDGSAPPEIVIDRPSLVFTGEQSNTTLAFGDAMVLKVYRQVAPGVNPDVEVHLALDRVGCEHIATPLGWVDSDSGVLAFLQEFLVGATEGWESAQASVRDLFVEADLHPSDCGADFAGEAARLGRVTAEVHASLREALPTAVLDAAALAARAAEMKARLAGAVAEVPDLAPYADGLAARFDRVGDLAATGASLPVQRVHGDLHLGQAVRTSTGWKVLDFEGEPARPAEERRALDSPLRDVAGLLRSLDYAARLVLLDHPDDPQRAYRAVEWVEHNSDAFCTGYAEAAGRDPREDDVLLRALEAEKAVYEVVYETRMRPAWAVLPMAAVVRLAG